MGQCAEHIRESKVFERSLSNLHGHGFHAPPGRPSRRR
ncbi:Hypothetical protein AA314_06192 [Archangium gephyra]|uniref:Uncharacterized protein n=1 Tax=Archangium gephyra TaxID=48 RepID=A0AAC8QCH7_9BACT|nr:Hypothetical protein AA314_06192 [Archangium gephyra]